MSSGRVDKERRKGCASELVTREREQSGSVSHGSKVHRARCDSRSTPERLQDNSCAGYFVHRAEDKSAGAEGHSATQTEPIGSHTKQQSVKTVHDQGRGSQNSQRGKRSYMIRAPHICYLPPPRRRPGRRRWMLMRCKGRGMRHTHDPSHQNGLGAAARVCSSSQLVHLPHRSAFWISALLSSPVLASPSYGDSLVL